MIETQHRAKTFTLGDREAVIVSDGVLHFSDRAVIFGPPQGDPALTAQLYQHPIDIGQNVLALRKGAGWVLFETGASSVDTYLTAGCLKANLLSAGIAPSHVMDLLPTHGHLDHIGGVVDKAGGLNFPNATIHLDNAEHTFWLDDVRLSGSSARSAQIARLNLAAAGDRVQTYRCEAEVLQGIHAISTPGHTLAHTSFMVSDRGEELFVAGDLVHDISQIENPLIATVFDFDQDQATVSRIKMLDYLARTEKRALFYHLPWPGLGYVRREGQGYRFESVND